MDLNASKELLSPSDPSFLKGTLVLNCGGDPLESILDKLESLWYGSGAALRQKDIVGLRARAKGGGARGNAGAWIRSSGNR